MNNFMVGKTINPLTDSTDHAHTGWEIIINISGTGYDVLTDKLYPFSPGTIICIPPGILHAKRADQEFEDIYITTEDPHCFHGKDALVALDDEFKSLENIFRLIHYYYFRDSQKISLSTASLFSALVNILYDRFEKKDVNPYCVEIQRKIIENFTDPEFVITDSMRNSPVCEDYLRKLFKKDFGITPNEYLIKLRIDKAKILLRNETHNPVSQVALSCGFYDMHYFSRVFKKITGVSPNQYYKSSELST